LNICRAFFVHGSILADSRLSKFLFEYGIVAQILIIILVFAKCPTLVCASLSFLVASSILVFYPIDTLSVKLLNFSLLCEREILEGHRRKIIFLDKFQAYWFINQLDRRWMLLPLFKKAKNYAGFLLEQLLFETNKLEKWSGSFLYSNLLLLNKSIIRKLNLHFKDLLMLIEETKVTIAREEILVTNMGELLEKLDEGCEKALMFVEGACCRVFMMTILSITQGILFIYAYKFSN
jgi:hypothetical protein